MRIPPLSDNIIEELWQHISAEFAELKQIDHVAQTIVAYDLQSERCLVRCANEPRQEDILEELSQAVRTTLAHRMPCT